MHSYLRSLAILYDLKAKCEEPHRTTQAEERYQLEGMRMVLGITAQEELDFEAALLVRLEGSFPSGESKSRVLAQWLKETEGMMVVISDIFDPLGVGGK